MKTLTIKTLVTIALCTTGLYAGNKAVAPVEAPVAVIPVTTPSPWYLGAGLAWAKLSGCDLIKCSYEDQTYGAMLRGGYDFNPNIGVEARYIRTFLDEGPFGGTPLEHVGLYLKPQYPVSERVNVYALLGYGYTKNLGNGNRLNYFDEDHGFGAGVGLEYDLSDREGDREENGHYDRDFDGYADQGKGWSLFVDYQRMLIKSGIPNLDAVTFGIRYDF